MGGGIMAVVINGTTGIDTIQDGTVTTAKIAADAVTTPKIADSVNLGRRNFVLNGDFRINQRAVTSSTTNGFLADRWNCGVNNTHTQAIVSDAPEGFKYSHKITVGSASANTVLGYFFTKIEAQNIIPVLGWDGAGNGSNAVLSFWVKSSVTGNYSIYARNNGDTENYIKKFTVNSANTWEYKTLSITPPPAGTWTTDNTSGLQLSFGLSGSASANAVASEGWHTANYIMTTDSTDLYTNAGATWQITGIQLEKGDTATPFEHRSFGEELALCQRYYEKSYSIDVVPGTATANGLVYMSTGTSTAGDKAHTAFFKVEKRSNPSISYWDSPGNASRVDSGGTNRVGAINFQNTVSVNIRQNAGGGYGSADLGFHFVASAEL